MGNLLKKAYAVDIADNPAYTTSTTFVFIGWPEV